MTPADSRTVEVQGAQVSNMSTNAADAFAEAARPFIEGTFHIPVETTFALTEVAQAASAAGHVAGRFVVTVPQADAP